MVDIACVKWRFSGFFFQLSGKGWYMYTCMWFFENILKYIFFDKQLYFFVSNLQYEKGKLHVSSQHKQ